MTTRFISISVLILSVLVCDRTYAANYGRVSFSSPLDNKTYIEQISKVTTMENGMNEWRMTLELASGSFIFIFDTTSVIKNWVNQLNVGQDISVHECGTKDGHCSYARLSTDTKFPILEIIVASVKIEIASPKNRKTTDVITPIVFTPVKKNWKPTTPESKCLERKEYSGDYTYLTTQDCFAWKKHTDDVAQITKVIHHSDSNGTSYSVKYITRFSREDEDEGGEYCKLIGFSKNDVVAKDGALYCLRDFRKNK